MYDSLDAYKQNMSISSKSLSEVKKWKIGETYDVIVTVKMTGLHQQEGEDVMGEFEIDNIISANNDPMELDDINNLNDNADFLRESSKYRSNIK